jgi:cyclic beta-1,2-glucan synthetase
MVHAIGSTLVRVFFTHRHLLEWVTSLQAKARLNDGLKSLFLRFGSSTWMVLFSGGIIFLFNPVSLSSAAPFLLVWWAAPIFSRWLSLSDKPGQDEAIGIEDARQLRLVGRRTWRFFTTFVTDKDHHLPPDNFQEDPNPVIAHRSSPTNFGLYLLSILAARDFGWIGMIDFVDKVGSTMTTLKKLPRCHGHFYNWYDTMDLRPLEPRYLSTVDSGNLAGHLLTLAQDCREVADQPWNQTSPGLGLNDTYSLLCESFAKVSKNRENSTEIEGIRTRINEIKNVLGRIPGDWNWSRFF